VVEEGAVVVWFIEAAVFVVGVTAAVEAKKARA